MDNTPIYTQTMQNYKLFLQNLEYPLQGLYDWELEAIAVKVDEVMRQKYPDGKVNKDAVVKETATITRGKVTKKNIAYMKSGLPKKLYKEFVNDDNLPALYFTVINAGSVAAFTTARGDLFKDRPDRLYDTAKRNLAKVIEACRQLGENKEALELLEQVTIFKTSENNFYNEWVAVFRKILVDAGFTQTAINKTILPELKRISKETRPTLPL